MIRIPAFLVSFLCLSLVQAQDTISLCAGDSLQLSLDTDSIAPDSVQWSIGISGEWQPADSSGWGEQDSLSFTLLEASTAWNGWSVQATAWSADSALAQAMWILEVDSAPAAPMIETAFPDSIYCYGFGVWSANRVLPASIEENSEWQWLINGEITESNPDSITLDFLASNFIVQGTLSNGCGTTSSNSLEVEVLPAPSVGAIGDDQIVCAGQEVEPLESPETFGGSGNWEYQWETSVDNGATWSFAGSGSFSFTPVPNNAVILSRFSATDLYGCGTYSSPWVTVEEYGPLLPGTVEASSDTACFGVDVDWTTSEPQGGSGAFTWVWTLTHDTTSMANTVEFEGNTSVTLENLQDTTFAQITFTEASGCGSVQSSWSETVILPEAVAPTIDADGDSTPICFGFDGPTLSVTANASGANGQFDLTWQVNSGSGWTDVAAGTEVFTPQAMVTSSSFQVIAESTFGCGTTTSNSLDIDVFAFLVPGTASEDQTVCHLGPIDPLAASPASGGGGAFSLQWQDADTGEAIDQPDAQSDLFTPDPLSSTTSFKVVYTSDAGCGSVESNDVNISVLPELIPGQILNLSTDTLCHLGDGTISASAAISGINLSTQWHSNASGAFAPLDDANGLDFQWTGAPMTTSFFLNYTSNDGCGTVASDTLAWAVFPPGQPPTIALTDPQATTTICHGFDAPEFQIQQEASGSSGGWETQWQIGSSADGPWTNTAMIESGYIAMGLTIDTWIQAVAMDQAGCESLTSNAALVEVLPELVSPEIPELAEMCVGADFGPVPFMEATGADGEFIYMWTVFSASGDSTISGTALTLTNLQSDVNLVLDATSSYGCGTVTSTPQTLPVADPLGPAFISPEAQSLCTGDTALLTLSQPSGGLGATGQQWFINTGSEWSGWTGPSGSELNLPLEQTTLVTAAWDDLCGTVLADTLEITAWPVPAIPNFTGSLSMCAGSTDNSLAVGNIDWHAQYTWSISPNAIISSGASSTQILFDVPESMAGASVGGSVTATYPSTGCAQNGTFVLDIATSIAPQPADILQMPGQDVLVCSDDDPCAVYSWGWRHPNSNWDTYLEGENEQYALIPNFDPDNRWYFVDISYDCDGDGGACTTRSWYNHDPFVGLNDIGVPVLRCYPNPASNHVFIDGADLKSLQLFTIQGQLLKTIRSSRTPSRLMLDNIPSGWYLIRAQLSNGQTESIQLLVE